MIRRGHARRAAEALELAVIDLGFPDDPTVRIDPPPVRVGASDLAVEVACRRGDAPAGQVIVVEPDLWAGVDVVPVRLAESMFAIRAPSLRLGPAAVRAMPLLDAEVRSPPARIAEPAQRPAAPPLLEYLERRSTALATIPQDVLREWLRRLFRASRLSSPAELEVVGVYERVPGGAIVSIAETDAGMAIRVNPRIRPTAATLVVGRARGSSTLIPVEIKSP
jgi:hypothetical protein